MKKLTLLPLLVLALALVAQVAFGQGAPTPGAALEAVKGEAVKAAAREIVGATDNDASTAKDKEADDDLRPADLAKVAEAVKSGLVRVEYTLQFDKGDAPQASGYGERCPNCGGVHGIGTQRLVEEERPLEMAGLLLSDKQVVAVDAVIHPRFVKKIEVLSGEQRVTARIAAYGQKESVVFLELDQPLTAAKPLVFDAAKEGPYLAVHYGLSNALWTIDVKPASFAAAVTETGRAFGAAPSGALIVDKEGVPVGLSTGEIAIDDSWKGSPAKWPVISASEMTKLLAMLEERADRGLLRVALNFRSPKKGDGETGRRGYGDDDDEGTEKNVLGVLADDQTVLVLTNLDARVTARLERIQVYPKDGEAVQAKFAGTLKDYGGFVATLEKPLSGAPAFSTKNIRDYANLLLLVADIDLQGEKKVSYYDHSRITSYTHQWKRRVYPEISGGKGALFVLDTDGGLVAFPISHRSKVSTQGRYGNRGESVMTPAAHLKEVLAGLAQNIDPSNAPLTEEQENRIAWLGVELQSLGRELARANKVSDLTQDGSTGGMVSYVYPDSPAAKAGVEPGYILLRIHAEDQPKPLEVNVEDSGFGGRFPWDRYDDLPEEYYDRVPQPWPVAENAFNQTITELGFGKKFEAEFFNNGQIVKKSFEVVEMPAHFASAARFKSTPMGVTVRDLTYEVRRYFQKKDDEPGVIVSKVEPGSKGSVAGVKPYEIITHVNDQPVKTAAEFEKAIDKQDELRLSVKRMTTGRVVKVKMTGPVETKDAKSGEKKDPAEDGKNGPADGKAPAAGTEAGPEAAPADGKVPAAAPPADNAPAAAPAESAAPAAVKSDVAK